MTRASIFRRSPLIFLAVALVALAVLLAYDTPPVVQGQATDDTAWLDTSFGTGGKVTTDFNSALDEVYAMAVQSDGKIVAAGRSNNGTNDDFAVARYNPDGTLDETFGTVVSGSTRSGKVTTAMGTMDDVARALAIDGNGNIVVAGNVKLAASGNDFGMGVARYTGAGELDTTFSSDGKHTVDFSSTHGDYAHAVAIDGDGNIVVVGHVFVAGEDFNFAVARLTSAGALDTNFDSDGKADFSLNNNGQRANAVAIDDDGNILVAGETWIPASGGTPLQDWDFAVARITPAGALDTTFDGDGWVSLGLGANSAHGQYAHALTLQDDGKILVAGRAWTPGAGFDFAVARLTSAGALDTTFGGSAGSRPGYTITGIGTGADYAHAVALDADGKVVLAGYSNNGTDNDFALARYTDAGELDATFGGDGTVTAAVGSGGDQANAVVVQSDGKIILAGTDSSDFALARFVPRLSSAGPPVRLAPTGPGSLDISFSSASTLTTPIGSGDDFARAVAIDSKGRIVVAGEKRGGGTNDDFAVARYLSGTLDTSFDGDGKVTTDFDPSADYADDVAVQPDDKIVVVGHRFLNSARDFSLARYNTDGSLDTDFDSDGKVTTDFGTTYDVAKAVAVQPDGKIVVVGNKQGGGTSDDIALARYTSTGALDNDFGTGGKVTTDFDNSAQYADDVALQPDGKIVVVGHRFLNNNRDFAVVRYDSDGTLDTGFGGGDGIVTTAVSAGSDVAYAVALQPDGKIVVAGESSDDFAVVRYDSDGTLDTDFGGGDGIVTTAIGSAGDYGRAVGIDPDGNIVVGGYSSNGTNNDFAVARYTPAGVLDGGPVTTAVGTGNDEAQDMIVDSEGNILLVGHSVVGGNSDFALAGYTAGGRPLTMLDGPGWVATDFTGFNDTARAVVVRPNGEIVAAGETWNEFNSDVAVVQHNSDGSLDTRFDGDGKVITVFENNQDSARAMALQSDGKIVVAGNRYFGSFLHDFALARYNKDGSLDTSFGTGGKVTTAFGDNITEAAYAMALQPDGKIVAAGHSNNVFAVARYTSAGALDTDFDDDGKVTTDFGAGNEQVYALAVQPDGKIVAAGSAFTGSSSDHDFALARYNSDGSLDTDFGAGGKVTTAISAGADVGWGMAVQPDGKIVVAGQGHNGANLDFALARYNPDGSLDTSFGTGGQVLTPIGSSRDSGRAVALQRDGKLVVAGVSHNGSTEDFALARYHPDGSLDTSFGTGGKVTTAIASSQELNAIALQDDDKIVVAGLIDKGGGTTDFAVARYLAGDVVGNNASLSGLSMLTSTDGNTFAPVSGAESLAPAFLPATAAYRATVGSDVTHVGLAPTAADGAATVTVAGRTVSSGGEEPGTIELQDGDNNITVRVTSEDGRTTKIYTVTVWRVTSGSEWWATITPGELSFGGFDYIGCGDESTCDLQMTDNEFTLSGTTFALDRITLGGSGGDDFQVVFTETPNAAIQALKFCTGATSHDIGTSSVVSNNVAFSWTAGVPVSLSIGTSCAQQAVNANLGDLAVEGSADGSAFSVLTGANALVPAFAAGATGYRATVGNDTTHVRLTPAVAATGSTVKVGRAGTTLTTVTSGSASAAIELAVGDNAITVAVTASDNTTRNYTVTVRRVTSGTEWWATLTPALVSGSRVGCGSQSDCNTQLTDNAFTVGSRNYKIDRLVTTGANDGSAILSVAPNDALRALQFCVGPSGFSFGLLANTFLTGVTDFTAGVPVSLSIGTSCAPQAAADPLDLSALTAEGSTDGSTFTALSGANAPAPAFDADTTTYRATVGNDVTHVRLTPTVAVDGSIVLVGKSGGTLNQVTSGSASAAIELADGDNEITVQVNLSDLSESQNYIVTVRRVPTGTEWYATLAAGEVTSGSDTFFGCNNSYTEDELKCSTASTLTEDEFSVVGQDYQVQRLGDQLRGGQNTFDLLLSHQTNAPLRGLTFCSGSNSYPLSSASGGGQSARTEVTWQNTDVGWTAGAPVSVSIGTSCTQAGNADLSALTAEDSADGNTWAALSGANALAPAFYAGTTGYRVTVGNPITQFRLTPTVAVTGSTVKVGKAGTTLSTVTSGSASSGIALAAGDNEITVEVTASDGNTTKNYTVTVRRVTAGTEWHATLLPQDLGSLGEGCNNGSSDDANKCSTETTLTDDDFTHDSTDYALTAVRSTGTLFLVFDTAPTTATKGLNFCVGASEFALSGMSGTTVSFTNAGLTWTAGVPVSLSLGTTCEPSADLSALTGEGSTDGSTFAALTGANTLVPAFDADTTGYRATVGNTITHVRLTPTVAVTGSTVKVGKAGTTLATVTSGSASAAVELAVGDNQITVEVTASDGYTQEYTVTVRRVPSGTEWYATLVPAAFTLGGSSYLESGPESPGWYE